MNPQQARARVAETFPQPFNRAKFLEFIRNLINRFDESKAAQWNFTYVKDAFKPHVARFERLGTYTTPEKEKLDVLIVHLTKESKLERARTAIRNFVADHLKTRDNKDAALVAFVSPSDKSWRFSYVKMEYAAVEQDDGKVGVQTLLTPARRRFLHRRRGRELPHSAEPFPQPAAGHREQPDACATRRRLQRRGRHQRIFRAIQTAVPRPLG